jgi:hypothetical protein
MDGTHAPGKQALRLAITTVLSKEHMSKIFDCNVIMNGGHLRLDYYLNQDKYWKLKDEELGKSILFTDHFDWETEKTVSAYLHNIM